jgi:signal transduction histidine kinase
MVWWASHMLDQSAHIAELSQMAGVSEQEIRADQARTHRMVFWEGGTFLVLLVTVSGALFWYYRRDLRRARGTQAFFAALTHELRTPLTSVRLQTEAIAAGEPSQELIERLLVDTHRLESQIDKTLELARIEGGGTLAEQAIRLDQWLERTLARCVPSSRPKAKAWSSPLTSRRRCRRCAATPRRCSSSCATWWRTRCAMGSASPFTSTCRRCPRRRVCSWCIATMAVATRATPRRWAACSCAAGNRAAPASGCTWYAC